MAPLLLTFYLRLPPNMCSTYPYPQICVVFTPTPKYVFYLPLPPNMCSIYPYPQICVLPTPTPNMCSTYPISKTGVCVWGGGGGYGYATVHKHTDLTITKNPTYVKRRHRSVWRHQKLETDS